MEFKPGDLVKVKFGRRAGQFGIIVEKASEQEELYRVKFAGDLGVTYYFKDELEKVEGIPCPKCIEDGKWVQLFEPNLTEDGLAQDCPIHGRFFLWV